MRLEMQVKRRNGTTVTIVLNKSNVTLEKLNALSKKAFPRFSPKNIRVIGGAIPKLGELIAEAHFPNPEK